MRGSARSPELASVITFAKRVTWQPYLRVSGRDQLPRPQSPALRVLATNQSTTAISVSTVFGAVPFARR